MEISERPVSALPPPRPFIEVSRGAASTPLAAGQTVTLQFTVEYFPTLGSKVNGLPNGIIAEITPGQRFGLVPWGSRQELNLTLSANWWGPPSAQTPWASSCRRVHQ